MFILSTSINNLNEEPSKRNSENNLDQYGRKARIGADGQLN